MPKNPDEHLEALIVRLHRIHPTYEATFPTTPKGFKALQRLVADHGYPTVRNVLEYCIAGNIVPRGQSAMPLVMAMCRKWKKGV